MKLINSNNWHDSYLEKIVIEYNKCLVELTDYNDKRVDIVCEGFRSIVYIGQYDENIIKDINIIESSDLIEKTKNSIKENYSYIETGLKQLEIELIDDVKIQIIAEEFYLNELKGRFI